MIRDLFHKNKTIYSIEVFPPKRTEDMDAIFETLAGFEKLSPAFISVTYGAGGSTSRKTADIAAHIRQECKIEALAHLTCASLHDEQDLSDYTNSLKTGNVNNILALRGDKPRDMSQEDFDNRLFAHASDLAHTLSESGDYCIAGACYPEKHQEAKCLSDDILHLKEKVDAGVDFLITQLFYDNERFYYFLDACHKQGIEIPITAGLMPITSTSQIKNIVSLSGASLPRTLTNQIAKYSASPDDLKKAGLEYTKKQMENLLTHGVEGIHLYSMNKVDIAEYLLG